MPIVGRSLGDAARTFCDHMNRVLALTLGTGRLVLSIEPGDTAALISFRASGKPCGVSIQTRCGPIELFLLQRCDSRTVSGGHQLRTSEYTYTLTPQDFTEPLFRWEYVRTRQPTSARWSRHHLQGPVELSLPGLTTLNAIHLPTGYVPFEDVIRFCIHDLGAAPSDPAWHDVLEESYNRFTSEFAPSR